MPYDFHNNAAQAGSISGTVIMEIVAHVAPLASAHSLGSGEIDVLLRACLPALRRHQLDVPVEAQPHRSGPRFGDGPYRLSGPIRVINLFRSQTGRPGFASGTGAESAVPIADIPDLGATPIPLATQTGDVVIVAAEIGHEVVLALIDTGATHSALSCDIVSTLGIPKVPGGLAIGFGGNAETGRVVAPPLRIGDRQVPPRGMIVVDLASHRSFSGAPIDLVIGLDLLTQWGGLQVCLDRRRVRLGPVAGPEHGRAIVPLRRDPATRLLLARASINGFELDSVLLDTGATHGMSIAGRHANDVAPLEAGTTIASIGTGGIAIERLIGDCEVRFGDVRLPVAGLRIEETGGFLDRLGFDGHIGIDLLNAHRFGIDIVRSTLVLEPRETPPQASRKSTVGLQGHYGPDGYAILHVMEGSPAKEAGLAAGDRITDIDGKRVSQAWARPPLNEWGLATPGTTYSLRLSDGATQTLTTRRFYYGVDS